MPVQLTIHQPGTASESLFQPASRYEFEQPPILLGNEQCSCQVPGATEKMLRISHENNTFVLECLTDTGQVVFQNKILTKTEKKILHSGDVFTVCGCTVNFYLSFPKRPVSWQSNLLGAVSKFGIGLALLIQLLCIFVLAEFLNRGQFWSGQQMRLNIISKTDLLRKEIHSINNPDPLARLILKGYQQELQQRTAYLREFSEIITRSQRKKMLQTLSDLEKQIQFLKEARITENLPPLQIDRPVAEIIEKAKHE